MKLEGLEVAHEDAGRAAALGKRIETLHVLSVSLAEITPSAVMLDDQDARPEQVDETRAVGELGDMLLVTCRGLAWDIEHLEGIIATALRRAPFVSPRPANPWRRARRGHEPRGRRGASGYCSAVPV